MSEFVRASNFNKALFACVKAQRVDLVAEAKYLSVVYNAARDATDLSIITTPERALEALASESVSRLKLAVGRWTELEARLKPTGGDNPKLLDAVVNGAAAGRAFLGHLYALSNEFELSVHELEAACPLLWEHQLALKSVDPHGWLDCYSSLSDGYVKLVKTENAVRLNTELVGRMPWFDAFLPVAPPAGETTLSTALGFHDRRVILRETKEAWVEAEKTRGKLNELVSEFFQASNAQKQSAILEKARKISKFATLLMETSLPAQIQYNLQSAVQHVRAGLAKDMLHEHELYFNTMEALIKGDELQKPEGDAKAVSQGFQSAMEVYQIFAYFKAQHLNSSSSRKSKPSKRQRPNVKESEVPPEPKPSTGSSILGPAHLTLLLLCALFALWQLASHKRIAFVYEYFSRIFRGSRPAPEIHPDLLEELVNGPSNQASSSRKKKTAKSTKKSEGGPIKTNTTIETKTIDSDAIVVTEPTPSVELTCQPLESEKGPEDLSAPMVEEDKTVMTNNAEDDHHPTIDLQPSTDSVYFEAFDYPEEEGPIRSEGEWISASSRNVKPKRSVSIVLEQVFKQQQLAKQQQLVKHHGDRVSKRPRTKSDAKSQPVVREKAPIRNSLPDPRHPPSPLPPMVPAQSYAATVADARRTPSPSDVMMGAAGNSPPAKGPFDHIKVIRQAPPTAHNSNNTRIIPDEDISECSNSSHSHFSPDNVAYDMEQMRGAHHHSPPYPMIVPVPVYYMAPMPSHFHAVHDAQQRGDGVFVMPPPIYDYYGNPLPHMPLQMPPVPEIVGLVLAVRAQIEYYFSPENLCRDDYLRSAMDVEGYVSLGLICKFNRIRAFNATPLMILEAVASSSLLSLAESPFVAAAKNRPELLPSLNENAVFECKVRCSVNPEIWPKTHSPQ